MRRRGWVAAALLGCLVAAALTGCGNPGGVDGELVDDWALVGEPEQFVPAVACHDAAYEESGALAEYQPVECAEPHRAETFHVGTFTGAAATGTAPPTRESAARRSAYAECDKQATEFLGADFRRGRLWLGVVVPSAAGWAGGARWFRCDLFEVPSVEDFDDPVTRTGSLAGALADAAAPLALGCFQVTAGADGSIDSMAPVACTKAHNSEFVGVYPAAASAAYPKSDADWKRMHAGCRAVVAAYVKVPDDDELQFRTGTVAVPERETDWKGGNHGVRCFLYLKDAKFTRSLRGAGPDDLPAR